MPKIKPVLLAEKLLDKIRRHPKQAFSPTELARSFRVSKADISAAVERLQSWGYIIDTGHRHDYIFRSAPDTVLDTEISFGLKTKILGCKIHTYRTVQSTNTIAAQLAESGAVEGTLVIAEQQTKGRGRLGRSWYSPAGDSLYFSLILRPKIHPRQAPGISLISAVALAETISSYGKVNVKIKWPNDVLISGLKTAGILTELSAEPDHINHVIVGIGVNINQRKSDFPEELKKIATSIRLGLKKKIELIPYLQLLLFNLEKEYLTYKKCGLSEVLPKIVHYSSLIGQDIILRIGRRMISGRVIEIDENGRLLVATPTGVEAFSAGEVTSYPLTP